jgi:hypothetical protein
LPERKIVLRREESAGGFRQVSVPILLSCHLKFNFFFLDEE